MKQGTTTLRAEDSTRLEHAKNYFNQAINLMKEKHYLPAGSLLKQVLKLVPNHPNSNQLLSIISAEQGDYTKALKYINLAISNQKDNADFYYNRAMLYRRLDKCKNAISDLEHVIKLNSNYHSAHLALARLFHISGDFLKAIPYYEQSLKWANNDVTAWMDLCSAYENIKQYAEAIRCCEISLYLAPENEKIYATLGTLYQKLSEWDKAKSAFAKALQIKPDFNELISPLLICNARLCDWESYQDSIKSIKDELLLATKTATQNFSMELFGALSLPFTPEELCQIAVLNSHTWQNSANSLRGKLKFKHRRQNHQRLRIGYISSSFRNFPTGHLTQDLYASHDRNRFEIFAYSYGPNDNSIYRKKIEEGCDHFIDIMDNSIEEACNKIYADKIDILVDLMGNTSGARLEINALRPAPINVRYLGSPSTSGSASFDYLISDAYITPLTEQSHYVEHLVLMPHCYQINPLEQAIASTTPTRAECGLPKTGFVFCAFNNSYKIEPVIFEVWMNILRAVPDSVLWLQLSDLSKDNLIQHAKRYDIRPERLVFANRTSKELHLARHVHADLYLDTHFYNAHTTASDALWMHVPVITYPGNTFQSRVAASLLNSLGLNELIMPDWETYEATAINLANNPAALTQLKNKLKRNSQTYPLFDTKRFVSNLEKAYSKMWENYCQNTKSIIVVQE